MIVAFCVILFCFCNLMKRADWNTFQLHWHYSLCQFTANKQETLILSDTAPIPLLPSITADMWYTRLYNSSVTASMCLQVQCLCCYNVLDLYAGPMAVLTLSLYKSLEKENSVGLMRESGWRWADVYLVLSATSSDRVRALVNTS